MLVANVFRPWRFRGVCQRRRRQARHVGRAHRALPGRRYDRKEWCALNKVAESSLCKWMTRFREEEPRPLFPQVERGVELDEGHASRPRAAALQARSPLPIRWKGDGRHPFRGEEIDDEALESPG